MVPVKHDNNIIHLSASCFGRYNAFADKEQNVVGKRIAESRKSAGLTYEAFSELLKGYGVSVSLSSIFKWENGSTVPNAYQLMAISHAFEIADMYSRFASTYQPEFLLSLCKREGIHLDAGKLSEDICRPRSVPGQ